jgi:hypothetical protein
MPVSRNAAGRSEAGAGGPGVCLNRMNHARILVPAARLRSGVVSNHNGTLPKRWRTRPCSVQGGKTAKRAALAILVCGAQLGLGEVGTVPGQEGQDHHGVRGRAGTFGTRQRDAQRSRDRGSVDARIGRSSRGKPTRFASAFTNTAARTSGETATSARTRRTVMRTARGLQVDRIAGNGRRTFHSNRWTLVMNIVTFAQKEGEKRPRPARCFSELPCGFSGFRSFCG